VTGITTAARRVRIGTAGWSIPRAEASRFTGEGTHLQRYARGLSGAEINSSFYRPHAAATYAKWAAATPPGFRFAVKVPKVITHEQELRAARRPLERFLDETSGRVVRVRQHRHRRGAGQCRRSAGTAGRCGDAVGAGRGAVTSRCCR